MKFLLLALFIMGCAHTPKNKVQTLVLIQGFHLNQHVWKETEKLLKDEGHQTLALERLGRDTVTPASLTEIARLSCQKIPDHSIIVAHSFGGVITNQMVGICPQKIIKIIYVTALVPLNGEKPFDIVNKNDFAKYLKLVTMGKFKVIPKEARAYFSGADATIKSTIKLPNLYSEWTSLGSEAISYDETTYKNLPKAYLYTERDVIISLTVQFQYATRAGIQNTDGIPAGHYPMTSNPEKLAGLISKWVSSTGY